MDGCLVGVSEHGSGSEIFLEGCIISLGSFTLLTTLGESNLAADSLTGRKKNDGGGVVIPW